MITTISSVPLQKCCDLGGQNCNPIITWTRLDEAVSGTQEHRRLRFGGSSNPPALGGLSDPSCDPKSVGQPTTNGRVL